MSKKKKPLWHKLLIVPLLFVLFKVGEVVFETVLQPVVEQGTSDFSKQLSEAVFGKKKQKIRTKAQASIAPANTKRKVKRSIVGQHRLEKNSGAFFEMGKAKINIYYNYKYDEYFDKSEHIIRFRDRNIMILGSLETGSYRDKLLANKEILGPESTYPFCLEKTLYNFEVITLPEKSDNYLKYAITKLQSNNYRCN
jgi:hypothetical protein